jgi:hypothetical protein
MSGLDLRIVETWLLSSIFDLAAAIDSREIC